MKTQTIRIIYLYLFSLVGLVMVVIGSARLVDLALRTWIFTEADKDYAYVPPIPVYPPDATSTKEVVEDRQVDYATRERHRDLSSSLAQIIIGLPLYFYHWKLVKREHEENKKEDKQV